MLIGIVLDIPVMSMVIAGVVVNVPIRSSCGLSLRSMA
jgi:hypothetical protein